MKRLWLIGLFFLALFAVQAVAQPMEEWVRRYNGPENSYDEPQALAVDSIGNVYVTGHSSSYSGFNSWVYATVKYDAGGNQLWVRRYDGSANDLDNATALAVDSNGNVYVTGISGSEAGSDYATIKYNAAGEQQWVRRYNGPANGYDQAYALAVDDLGNVYVTGLSLGSDTNSDDYATIKYDAEGNQLWVNRYNGPGDTYDQASALAVDSAGNVYVTGTSRIVWSSGSGSATIKYDAEGNQLWVNRYNGPDDSYNNATALAVDSNGNVYVTGESTSSPDEDGYSVFYYATIKYDAAGNQLWVNHYNPPNTDVNVAQALAIDSAGNVYVTGRSGVFGANNVVSDYATIKYDAAGNQLWVNRYSGSGNGSDGANALAVDDLGNVYVTGRSYDSETDSDCATVKYDADGNQLWAIRYNGPGNSYDDAKALVVDNFGNVYVTGQSVGSGTSSDYATIKYSQNLAVSIDIKPGDKRNIINPRAKGDLWVAVLSDREFDPLLIDIPTLQFGPQGAQALRHQIKDVNHDGFEDLLLRFKISATGMACGDTEATLIGETVDGQILIGTDSVKTVGCKPGYSGPNLPRIPG